MAEVVLLETGPLVALADRGEKHHQWATALSSPNIVTFCKDFFEDLSTAETR